MIQLTDAFLETDKKLQQIERLQDLSIFRRSFNQELRGLMKDVPLSESMNDWDNFIYNIAIGYLKAGDYFLALLIFLTFQPVEINLPFLTVSENLFKGFIIGMFISVNLFGVMEYLIATVFSPQGNYSRTWLDKQSKEYLPTVKQHFLQLESRLLNQRVEAIKKFLTGLYIENCDEIAEPEKKLIEFLGLKIPEQDQLLIRLEASLIRGAGLKKLTYEQQLAREIHEYNYARFIHSAKNLSSIRNIKYPTSIGCMIFKDLKRLPRKVGIREEIDSMLRLG